MQKWILITGASSGIGRIIAKYIDSCGYHVVLLARNKEKLESIQAELVRESLVISFDLTDLSGIESIFEVCQNTGIKLDGLVHCAGTGNVVPIRNTSAEDLILTMKTNFFSFFELGKCFSLRNYSNTGASIIAISSISPLTCLPGSAAYAASKASINTVVRVMSKEFMKRKIRVNAILPGYVNTPLGPAEDDVNYIAQQPLGIIKAEYVAYFTEYLLSDKAKYMTGTLFPMSGGMAF